MSPHTQHSPPSEKDRAMERTLIRSDAQPTSPAPSKTTWPLRLLSAITLWRRNAHTRRQLARLDDRQLADAGISVCDRDMELNKPFWRD